MGRAAKVNNFTHFYKGDYLTTGKVWKLRDTHHLVTGVTQGRMSGSLNEQYLVGVLFYVCFTLHFLFSLIHVITNIIIADRSSKS